MALRLQQSGIQPIGNFDGYDDILTTIKGGEVGTFFGVKVTGTDKAAYDQNGADGYVGIPPNQKRPVITNLLVSGNRPLMLLDEGSANYGTLLGSVVGGTVGQQSINGAVLGPHTALASGKITCWDKAGTYAVTLDAVDTTAVTGLIPSNSTLSVGDPLYATSTGKLTPRSASSFEGTLVVARFIEFTTDRSLVTTPNQLVSALNSGGGAQLLQFTQAIIFFNPPVG